jgi:glucosamine-6-phosphate deaminase
MNQTAPTLHIAQDDTDFAARAADLFIAALETCLKGRKDGKGPLVVLPTGNTPLGMYRELIARYGQRQDLWQNLRFLALDEYAGLEPDDARLFYGWVSRAFLDPAGVPPQNRLCFNSNAANPHDEIARVDQWLKDNGPIDIAVLGLGTNGHIAFNEPGSAFHQAAHAVTLTQDSITANAKYWGGENHVPKHAYTLGLGQLSAARQTILLVNGAHKATILKRVLHGDISTDVPATYLRQQAGVTILADRAACPV